MAITYQWAFKNLKAKDIPGASQVVYLLDYKATGTDGTHKGVFKGQHECGSVGQTFTAWDDLTPEIVKSWLPAHVIAKAQAAIKAQIDKKASDAAENKTSGLPWVES